LIEPNEIERLTEFFFVKREYWILAKKLLVWKAYAI